MAFSKIILSIVFGAFAMTCSVQATGDYLWAGSAWSLYLVDINNGLLGVSRFVEDNTMWITENSTDTTACGGDPAIFIRDAANTAQVIAHDGTHDSPTPAPIRVFKGTYNAADTFQLWCHSTTDNELTAAYTDETGTYHLVRNGSVVKLELQDSLNNSDAKFFFAN